MTYAGKTLQGKTILVVEDEPFIAYDIMDGVESAGGIPVGPAGTVKAAIEIIETVGFDAAILDVNLHDGDVGPVIAELQARRLPCIIHTGAGLTNDIRQRHPDLLVFYKPTAADILASALASLLKSQ